MNCKYCNAKIESESKFCNICGSPVPEKKPIEKSKFSERLGGVIFTLILIHSLKFVYNEYIKINSKNEGVETAKIVSNNIASTEWKEFTSVIGGFKSKFPSDPEFSTEIVQMPDSDQTAEVNTYSAVLGSDYFAVGVIKYSVELNISVPDVFLEGILNGMLRSNPKNKLLSSSFGMLQEAKALNFIINSIVDGENQILCGKNIISDSKTLYQVAVVYDTKNYDEDTCRRFVDSFELLKNQK